MPEAGYAILEPRLILSRLRSEYNRLIAGRLEPRSKVHLSPHRCLVLFKLSSIPLNEAESPLAAQWEGSGRRAGRAEKELI